ncbi:MAG TPA: alcohol dehydrogenase catalytic domain-containing protein [Acidothermaceae bacterium]|jgi:threonine dehydrogenase-like Zn-dependent dehydrogenase
MRALVLAEFRQMELRELPKPVVASGEVLVRVAYVGICGTDLHGYTGANGRRVPGQVMGHEASGWIAAAAPLGSSSSDNVGQAVTFNPLISCGHCAACNAGHEQLCENRRVIGVDPTIVSAFAEYVVVPAKNVHALPPTMPLDHGALVEPVAVALHAARRGNVSAGDSVLILGGGPIGQSAVLAARASGAARVAVSEIDAGRRKICERLGADAFDPMSGPLAAQLLTRWNKLADVAIDAVGIGPSMRDAVDAIRSGGTVVLVGMGATAFELSPYPITTAEKSMVGSYCYASSDFADAVQLVADYAGDVAELIASRVPLVDAPGAFERLDREGDLPGKVLIQLAASR